MTRERRRDCVPPPSATDAGCIEVRVVTEGDWRTILRLFGEKGACGGCWCMWWRVPKGGKTWQEAKGARNRERLRRLLKAGKVHAVIAYAGREPVGWCSFGPRASFPRLDRVRALARDFDEGTWSIVCFYVPARWRSSGVATSLLEAATREAFARGAREIEGYPVVPSRPGDKIPAAFAWTGVPSLFEKAGYVALPRGAASRPIFLSVAKR